MEADVACVQQRSIGSLHMQVPKASWQLAVNPEVMPQQTA